MLARDNMMSRRGVRTRWPSNAQGRPTVQQDEIYDLTIIGGGPVGLFGLFYAGMREMKTKVIDSLEQLGGQLIAIYPEKFIYDMPGFPKIKAKDLVRDMVAQGLQYNATPVLGEKVEGLQRREDGIWQMTTDRGTMHLSKTVVITAGAGGFAPRKLDLPGLWELEGRSVFYFVTDLEAFRDKDVLIIGGGDSAVDWALHLEGIANSLALCHRRDRFRAHEGSVKELLNSTCEVNLFWEVKALQVQNGDLTGVTIFHNKGNEEREIKVDAIILSLGFIADLGPIKTWGLEMKGGAIKVNSRMETNLPGVYAAGDIATFDGKLKLIATGTGEVAVAVNYAKTFIDPTARAFPGHSSDMVK
jgi:thioredoxin reductase